MLSGSQSGSTGRYFKSLTLNLALNIALKNDHFNICMYIVLNINVLNYSDDQGRTPLFFAIENRHFDLLKLLSEFGADPTLWASPNTKIN